MKNNLTNLAAVKDYVLGTSNSETDMNSDRILTRLISSVSQAVFGYLNRSSFVSQQYIDTVDGPGGPTLFLKEWPVTSVIQVICNNTLIAPVPDDTGTGTPPSPAFGAFGYRFEAWNGLPPGNPSALEGKYGFRFWAGHLNVKVTYTAGYLVSDEAQTIPDDNTNQIQTDQPYGSWIADNGVTYADGTPLALVASNPSQGQYSLVTPTPTLGSGVYQFAAADASQAVKISYSFVPADVEGVVLDMIMDDYSRRSRPGVRSGSISGYESASYDLSGLPQYAVNRLQSYVDVLPH